MRGKVFFLIDRLQKGSIKAHLKDLVDFDNLLEEELIEAKKLRLRKITNYAKNNCEFYKEYDNLESFPIINKEIIKKNTKSFLSKEYPLDKLIPAITSGSTGTPFKVYHDKNKKIRNSADTIHFARKANYNIGEPLFYLKIWNQHNRKSWFMLRAQNIYPINVFDLSSKGIQKCINQWNQSRNSIAILGYASAIVEIAKFLSKNKKQKKFSCHSIITMSEGLDMKSREFVQKIFDCPVYGRYSNVENGIIAQNFDCGNSFVINSASYKIEIFKLDSDQLEEDGEIGRIIITDYFNYGMPLIRYDTGDIGALRKIKTNNKIIEVLESIEGRRMDAIYDTSGNLLSSFIITNGMWNYPEINQYQFIQVSQTSYMFKININTKFEREEELIKQFKEYLGSDAEIYVEYVNEIPLLSSGKRKKVVNLMTGN